MSQDTTDRNGSRLRELRGFVFDLDGTIWEGPQLMPGAVELVADLRAAGLRVVFASNSSRHGAGVLRSRLAEMGIDSSPDEMLAALDLAGEEVRRQMGIVRVLPLGTDELTEGLRASGHEILADEDWPRAQAVVVGIDPHFSYDRLRAASRAVAAGASFFAVNLDRNFPIGPGLFDPGCGALAAAIATAGGSHPIGIGKPELPMFRAAIERIGGEPHQVAMVGDSTASDMAGGHAAGMYTIWLNPEHRGEIPEDVDLHVGDLPELHRLWRRSCD